jgi:hypothetical protein
MLAYKRDWERTASKAEKLEADWRRSTTRLKTVEHCWERVRRYYALA